MKKVLEKGLFVNQSKLQVALGENLDQSKEKHQQLVAQQMLRLKKIDQFKDIHKVAQQKIIALGKESLYGPLNGNHVLLKKDEEAKDLKEAEKVVLEELSDCSAEVPSELDSKDQADREESHRQAASYDPMNYKEVYHMANQKFVPRERRDKSASF